MPDATVLKVAVPPAQAFTLVGCVLIAVDVQELTTGSIIVNVSLITTLTLELLYKLLCNSTTA